MNLFTTINHIARKKIGITIPQYSFCDEVWKLQANSYGPSPGWCSKAKESIADDLDYTKRTIQLWTVELINLGIIEQNERGWLRTTRLWYDTVIWANGEADTVMKKPLEVRIITDEIISQGGEIISPYIKNIEKKEEKEKNKKKRSASAEAASWSTDSFSPSVEEKDGEEKGDSPSPLSQVSESTELPKGFPSGTTKKHYDQAAEAIRFYEEWVKRYPADKSEIQRTIAVEFQGRVTKLAAYLMSMAKNKVTIEMMKAGIAWKCERMSSFQYWRNINANTILKSNFQNSIESGLSAGWAKEVDGEMKFFDRTSQASAVVVDRNSHEFRQKLVEMMNLNPGADQEVLANYLEENWI